MSRSSVRKLIVDCLAVVLLFATFGALVPGLASASEGHGPPQNPGAGWPPNLDAEWWQWALSFEASLNPVLDTTGEFCSMGQRGGIFFLAGTFGTVETRHCTVAEGKHLFLPLLNQVCIVFAGETVKQNRGFCRDFINAGDILELTVDGIPVPANDLRRLTSGVFELTLTEGNVLGYSAGVYGPAVADGIWARLRPLPAGDHTIHLRGGISGGFGTEVTYHLHVLAPVRGH